MKDFAMLLQTKFLAPAYSTKSVERTQILSRLTPRSARKLILVSAPAGYGKTTLVSQWLQHENKNFCWLSLDNADDEPVRFWRYLIGSINSRIENIGAETIRFLESTPTQIEAAITSLVNALNEHSISGHSLTIVLDDFHVIQNKEILQLFTYFIDFIPANIEVIITTRFEPSLPISRWSVKNWVDQIYSSDLVFSYDESKVFFNAYMGLTFTDKQIDEIFKKTEGWIAAMQLTALSASSTPGTEQKYLSTHQLFADDRHFSDYILSEILEHQTLEISNFLLETACLLRLNTDLCDHIRNKKNSKQILEHLLASNLFLIPLDKNQYWFRYHDMFRDALLKRARSTLHEKVIKHQKLAVDWLTDNNQAHEAIEQAVQLEDWDLLTFLLSNHGNNLIHEGHHLPVLEWLSKLPDGFVSQSPRSIMLKIWALYFSNKIEIIPPLLNELEILIDQQRLDNVKTSTHELIDLHSEMSLIRAYLARSQSDLKSANLLTKEVLKELDSTNMPLKSVTYYGIGLDSFAIGDLDSAETALLAAINHGKREKKYTTVLSSSGLLGWIYYYQGKLEIALETGISNQQWIDSYHDPSQPRIISCWQNSALAMIYTEKAEFTIAEAYINPLLKHLEIGTEAGQHIIIQYVRATLLFAQKQFVDAIECIDDALHVYQHKKESIVFSPPSLSALKSKCLLAMGKHQKAKHVIDGLDSTSINAIPLNFEDINLTKARIYTEQAHYSLALEMLDRLIIQTKAHQHIYHLIQALSLKALVHLKMHDTEAARASINESIHLASQDGFISVYTNENKNIQQALALCSDPTISDRYLQKLTSILGIHANLAPTQAELPGAAALESNKQLLEPLSQRELEVLDLINQGLANKEIARKLTLAPATVKAHIRNLYGKIEAKSRTEALSKARSLGLI
ncbi:MAG: LuxR family maltose regulon positive regulatory protein [Pseudohongiellaceae bacterium]